MPTSPHTNGIAATRCATGVPDLDKILDGGFPRGNTILVAGGSGIGKTTLGVQFLCEGARRNEPSCFISVTEPTSMLKRNLANYRFFKPDLVDPARLTLLDLRAIALRMGLQDGMFQPTEHVTLVDTLQQIARELKLKRLVIDSITAICQWLHDPVRIRDFAFRLGLALSDLNCTTLLTSETPPRELKFSNFGVEEFISDGIVFLCEEEHGRHLARTLQVIKMRGTAHDRSKHYMMLSRDGMTLSANLKLESMQKRGFT
ncbi:MAG TPA: ATPase domain-containing protein [Candidatus Thermoplasmatota archaeon]|nr:ATPase domain-containing protein [Candidatus Thermoplasmatota archaeon]